ncbi:MAG: DUF1015 domain-containing protein [Candidatus Cloacimonetes bacterium]|nr:DUF1015 domain-containing protein [Candidatus Cloacimonadota bacterium]
MAVFKPFKAVRPYPEYASEIASLPYDVMDSNEAREEAKKHPLSFLHVEKPEIDLDPSIDLYDDRVYAKAKENLYKYIHDKLMLQDDKPAFYVYKQVMDGRPQIGLVGLASIDDYINNKIKKHELTRAEKEADRIRHVDTCNAHSSPVFFTYRHQDLIDKAVSATIATTKPVYNFISDDGIGHALWIIDDMDVIHTIQAAFSNMESLYVADGHHRTASAVRVGQMRREQHPNYTGDEEFNYIMAVIFPDNQLKIMDYNRIVKDLNGNSKQQFIEKVKKSFDIVEFGKSPYHPESTHTFSMYLDGLWYKLTAKAGSWDDKDTVKSLDVSILQNNLLHPILGIEDPRRDKRIDFVGGIRGLKELQARVDSGIETVAFAMFPTTMGELIQIADESKIMPPKSTWFEPKLRSGLFIHLID